MPSVGSRGQSTERVPSMEPTVETAVGGEFETRLGVGSPRRHRDQPLGSTTPTLQGDCLSIVRQGLSWGSSVFAGVIRLKMEPKTTTARETYMQLFAHCACNWWTTPIFHPLLTPVSVLPLCPFFFLRMSLEAPVSLSPLFHQCLSCVADMRVALVLDDVRVARSVLGVSHPSFPSLMETQLLSSWLYLTFLRIEL